MDKILELLEAEIYSIPASAKYMMEIVENSPR